MKPSNISAALAVALLLPAFDSAVADSPPPAQAAAVAALKTATKQMKQDQAAVQADWTALQACKAQKGANCDAVNTTFNGDRQKVETDRASINQAVAQMKKAGIVYPRSQHKKRVAKPKKPSKKTPSQQ
jgi:hypothetical protein